MLQRTQNRMNTQDLLVERETRETDDGNRPDRIQIRCRRKSEIRFTLITDSFCLAGDTK